MCEPLLILTMLTFHSLEDTMVPGMVRSLADAGGWFGIGLRSRLANQKRHIVSAMCTYSCNLKYLGLPILDQDSNWETGHQWRHAIHGRASGTLLSCTPTEKLYKPC